MRPATFSDLAISLADPTFWSTPFADSRLIIEFLPEQWMELSTSRLFSTQSKKLPYRKYRIKKENGRSTVPRALRFAILTNLSFRSRT